MLRQYHQSSITLLTILFSIDLCFCYILHCFHHQCKIWQTNTGMTLIDYTNRYPTLKIGAELLRIFLNVYMEFTRVLFCFVLFCCLFVCLFSFFPQENTCESQNTQTFSLRTSSDAVWHHVDFQSKQNNKQTAITGNLLWPLTSMFTFCI